MPGLHARSQGFMLSADIRPRCQVAGAGSRDQTAVVDLWVIVCTAGHAVSQCVTEDMLCVVPCAVLCFRCKLAAGSWGWQPPTFSSAAGAGETQKLSFVLILQQSAT